MRRTKIDALAFAALAVACVACSRGGAPHKHDSKATSEHAGPSAPTRHVVLSDEQLRACGVVAARLDPRTQSPQVRASAVVVEDPSSSFTLRAPIAGAWIAGDAAPSLGRLLAAGASVGELAPRLTAVEVADARTRVAAAHGEVEGATAALEGSRRARERVEALNAADKNASDRAVEEARVKEHADAARLAAARETVAVLEAVLDPKRATDARVPLVIATSGEVVEVLARPGEELQAGAAILRVADLGRPLVRVTPPPSSAARDAVDEARLQDPFDAATSWTARFVGPDPAVERAIGRAFLYRVDENPKGRLRPGTALTAWLDEGPSRAGFRLPRSAVVRVHGDAWVYVRDGERSFERVPVVLERSKDGDWFVTDAWASEREVVVTGAHALLTAELASVHAIEED